MTSFTQPVPRAPANSVPLPVVRGTMLRLKLSQIRPSKFNPRHEESFDKQGQLDLEASIAERGLLQNLVVRPVYAKPDDLRPDHYELQGGERRYRALKNLKVDEVDVRVIEGDDGQSLAIQLVENVDRKNLTPMEEAEGFAKLQALDPERYTTDEIARMVGKTQRFVQQRLAMARNLAPEAQELIKKGELNVEAARTLATAPLSTQRQILDDGIGYWSDDFHGVTADEIREEILKLAVPIDKAAFDTALYDGEYIEEGKKKLFADVEKFDALQLDAAKALVKKLKAEWPRAQIIKSSARHNWAWADTGKNLQYESRKGTKANTPYKVAEDKVTAVVWIDQDKCLHHAEGVTRTDNLRGSTAISTAPQTKPETPEHAAARKQFAIDVRAAALKKPDLVRRLVALALLQVEYQDLDDETENAVKDALPAVLKPFAFHWFHGDQTVKALKAMEGVKPAELDRAIAGLAVAQIGWGDWPRNMPAEIKAVAATVGVKFVEPRPAPEKKPDAGPADKEAKPGKTKAVAKPKVKVKAKAKTPAAKKKAATSRKHL